MAEVTSMKFKAIYSVAEVAEMMGLSEQQTLRRLKRAKVVEGEGRGKKIDVPLTKLRTLLKEQWESAVLVARVKKASSLKSSLRLTELNVGPPVVPQG